MEFYCKEALSLIPQLVIQLLIYVDMGLGIFILFYGSQSNSITIVWLDLFQLLSAPGGSPHPVKMPVDSQALRDTPDSSCAFASAQNPPLLHGASVPVPAAIQALKGCMFYR